MKLINKKRINFNRGFTFIEILVVVTIIGVLASIGIVSYQSVNEKSRDNKRKADIESIRSALEMYRADNGNYPVSLSSLETDYIQNLPTPPKSTDCTTGDYGHSSCYSPNGCSDGECAGYSFTITLEASENNYTVYNP
jgi:general secretion pathway protein G